ncbi:pilus assembly protein [Rhizobium laguerreae]|nr:pilus assembly protein [Rhizobium laguerreae]
MFSQHRPCFAMNPMKIDHACGLPPRPIKNRSLQIGLRGCLRDKRGQSGIEFALLLPLMLLLIAATIDLGQALMIRRKINQIAAITGDIVSQEDSWVSSDVTTVLKGGASTLSPFDATDLKIVVSVLDIDAVGNGKVNWSRGFQTEALAAGTAWPQPIPVSVVESGVQMVVTRVDYNVKSALTGLLTALTGIEIYSFTGTSIARPRVGDSVKVK